VQGLSADRPRLHRERTPRLVLDAMAAQSLAQLVACYGEEPRSRRLRPRLVTGKRGECGSEGLSGEVEGFLRPGHAAAKEGEH